MNTQDNIEKASLGETALICVCAAAVLSFGETAICVAGGWRLPWHVTLGLYFAELALGFIFFVVMAVLGLGLSRLSGQSGAAATLTAVYGGFPLIFGFHWLIGVDTPAVRWWNLCCYTIIGGVSFLVWFGLAHRRRNEEDSFGARSIVHVLLLTIASFFCFELFLTTGKTAEFFPHFFAAYSVLFIITGRLALNLESRTARKKESVMSAISVVAAILVAAVGLALASQLKTAFLDRRPVYEAPRGKTDAKDRPNVILISLDTLRADRLSCYGYEKATSPGIDRLAGQGVRFENAISQAPWTLPSHSSLLTSRYPFQLKNHTIGENPSLMEILREEGYTTVAFTGGDFVSADAFGKDFDYFDDQGEQIYRLRQSHSLLMSMLHTRRFARRFGVSTSPLNIFNGWRFWRPKLAVARASFSAQRRNAAEWLEKHGSDGPFFMFLHTYSIHDYFLNRKPAKENAKLFNPGYEGILDGVNLDYHSEYPTERKDIDQIRALYDGEILDADAELGMFIDDLQRLGLWENSIIVLLSDHGEGFEPELNRLWHSDRLNDDLLRVPLIIVYPGKIAAGKTVASQVALLDIMPTILDFVDIPPPEGIEGISLRPIIAEEGPAATRSVFSEVAGWGAFGVSLRTDTHKYIKYPDRAEFYELGRDPRETANLAGEWPAKMKEAQPLIDEFFARAQGEIDYDKETLDRMRAVGYLQ